MSKNLHCEDYFALKSSGYISLDATGAAKKSFQSGCKKFIFRFYFLENIKHEHEFQFAYNLIFIFFSLGAHKFKTQNSHAGPFRRMQLVKSNLHHIVSGFKESARIIIVTAPVFVCILLSLNPTAFGILMIMLQSMVIFRMIVCSEKKKLNYSFPDISVLSRDYLAAIHSVLEIYYSPLT